jgi:5-methylcytosine-specific restriction endonuclease McrA
MKLDYSQAKQLIEEQNEKRKREGFNMKQKIVLEQEFVKGKKCEKCGNDHNLTYDHIIPKQILVSFNINVEKDYWEENGQVLCYSCNRHKSNILDFSNPKTFKKGR